MVVSKFSIFQQTHLADLLEAVEVELTHEALETRVSEILGEDVLLKPPRVFDLKGCAICANRHDTEQQREGDGKRGRVPGESHP